MIPAEVFAEEEEAKALGGAGDAVEVRLVLEARPAARIDNLYQILRRVMNKEEESK